MSELSAHCVRPSSTSNIYPSATDGRNKMGGPDYYSEDKWKTVFTDPDSLAKGKYSPAEGDTTGRAGMRRYGASKLCEVMMV